MAASESHQAQAQARREAVPFVVIAAGALVGLGAVSARRDWELIDRRLWWIWLVLAGMELVLAVALFSGLGVVTSDERRKHLAEQLIGLVVTGSVIGLVLLVVSLVHFGSSLTGGQLLLSALALLLTNVVAFALALWELDCGGPVRRALSGKRQQPDIQFPQDENSELARPNWAPRFVDYAYVSLTNSIAFSPTDSMPLTRIAKGLMAVQSVISILTLLVVAARAINILGT